MPLSLYDKHLNKRLMALDGLWEQALKGIANDKWDKLHEWFHDSGDMLSKYLDQAAVVALSQPAAARLWDTAQAVIRVADTVLEDDGAPGHVKSAAKNAKGVAEEVIKNIEARKDWGSIKHLTHGVQETDGRKKTIAEQLEEMRIPGPIVDRPDQRDAV